MSNWPVKTLGEVCEVSRGTSITQKETTAGTVPVVAGGVDVAYFHSIANREAGCITISSSGANAGFVNRWSMPIFASDCSTVISRREGLVLPDFAFRFLQFKQYFINSELRRGAAQPHVYAKDIAAIEIPIPPLEEQNRIVELLNAATARVTELSACYEQARTHANNLFTSALRDELEGNPDWPVKTLGEVAEVNPREPALSEDAPFVPMDAVNAGMRDVQYTQSRGQRSGARARAGDILFARITPCLQNGKVALVQEGIARCGGSTEFIVVRAGSEVLKGYLYQWITSDHIRDEVTALMKGATGRQRLNAEDLALTQLSVPPLEEQKQIVARLDLMKAKILEMVGAYDAKMTAANNLRQSILEAAFAGQL